MKLTLQINAEMVLAEVDPVALEVQAATLLLAAVMDAEERLGFERMIAPIECLLLMLLSTLTRLSSMGPPSMRTVNSTHGPPLNPVANKVNRFVMGPSDTVCAMSVEVVMASGVITMEGRLMPRLLRR